MVLSAPQGEAEGNVEGRNKAHVFVGVVVRCFVILPSQARRNSGCCFLRKLVSFEQRLVTRSPPIRKDI